MIWLDPPGGWTTYTMVHPETLTIPRAGTLNVQASNTYIWNGQYSGAWGTRAVVAGDTITTTGGTIELAWV